MKVMMIQAALIVLSVAQLAYAMGRWIDKTRDLLQNRERKAMMERLDWTRDPRAERRRRAAAPVLGFLGR
jgi:hypothetical protein